MLNLEDIREIQVANARRIVALLGAGPIRVDKHPIDGKVRVFPHVGPGPIRKILAIEIDLDCYPRADFRHPWPQDVQETILTHFGPPPSTETVVALRSKFFAR